MYNAHPYISLKKFGQKSALYMAKYGNKHCRWGSKSFFLMIVFKKDFIYLFLEGERREKEERNINVWLPLMCLLLGTWPTTQACALTGN